MRIALSDLEYNIKGSKSKAIFHPMYLQEEEKNKVQSLIQFLEVNLSKKRSEVDFEVLGGLFPSEKIAKSLVVSASRNYSFSSRSIEDILGLSKQTQKEKSRTGDMVSFLSSVDDNNKAIRNLTAEGIRERVFDEVNKNTKGFVPISNRKELSKQIEEKLKIPPNSLDSLLYFDLDSEKTLVKSNELDSIQLIRNFNFDTIETILCFSLDLQMKVKKLPGYLAKNLVYISKKNYVFTEITLEEGGYKITIEPPLELFTDKGGWGKNISNVATYILRNVLREKIAFYLRASVEPRNRIAAFTLQSSELPLLPSFGRDEEEEFRPEIDSKIEGQFQKTWRRFQGWKARAEPEAIIVGKRMYVPDFLLERSDKSIYLEIVGFYTMKYVQKKRRQMQELEKLGVPIIYLIDESLRDHFIDLSEIKKVFYSGTQVPNSNIIRILEANYSDFNERVSAFLKKTKEICKSMDETKSMMEIRTLQDKLEAYSSDEVEKILGLKEIIGILKTHAISFLSSYGLVKDSVIQEIEEMLNQISTIPLSELKEEFPEYKEALIPISQHLGFKVKWKSIEEIEIISP